MGEKMFMRQRWQRGGLICTICYPCNVYVQVKINK
jgi:hypothetical protein